MRKFILKKEDLNIERALTPNEMSKITGGDGPIPPEICGCHKAPENLACACFYVCELV